MDSPLSIYGKVYMVETSSLVTKYPYQYFTLCSKRIAIGSVDFDIWPMECPNMASNGYQWNTKREIFNLVMYIENKSMVDNYPQVW